MTLSNIAQDVELVKGATIELPVDDVKGEWI
jgi:hypothetical protein